MVRGAASALRALRQTRTLAKRRAAPPCAQTPICKSFVRSSRSVVSSLLQLCSPSRMSPLRPGRQPLHLRIRWFRRNRKSLHLPPIRPLRNQAPLPPPNRHLLPRPSQPPARSPVPRRLRLPRPARTRPPRPNPSPPRSQASGSASLASVSGPRRSLHRSPRIRKRPPHLLPPKTREKRK